MLTLQDCVDFSGLSPEEIQVIAEHEHVPEIVAAELGQTLLSRPRGLYTLRCFIQDNLAQAVAAGQREKELRLREVLARFNAAHPVPAML
ncbi:MAG: hypothetical protein HYU77_09720 [Betaproteobacteria bacterium]|nr:hypothetical protein [Betaproteobacteria bacterium]